MSSEKKKKNPLYHHVLLLFFLEFLPTVDLKTTETFPA